MKRPLGNSQNGRFMNRPYKIAYHGALCKALREGEHLPYVRISENASGVFGGMFAYRKSRELFSAYRGQNPYMKD